MYINVSEIPPEGFDFPRGAPQGFDVNFEGRELFPLRSIHISWLEFNAAFSGQDLLFNGRCGGAVSYQCDRCGDDISTDVDLSFHRIFESDELMGSGGDIELKRGDLEITLFDGEGFYLEDVIYEQLILTMPQQALCKEDCRGLCQKCGTNRNSSPCNCIVSDVDPRLEKLKTLREKME